MKTKGCLVDHDDERRTMITDDVGDYVKFNGDKWKRTMIDR